MVVGIAGVGDGKSFGRIGLKTLVYFEGDHHDCVSCSGSFSATCSQPGVGTEMSQLGHADISRYQQATQQVQGHHGLIDARARRDSGQYPASIAKVTCCR